MDLPEELLCDDLMGWKVVLKPDKYECAECIKTGSQWVHLRTCQTCGVTLCCDSSPGKHASSHFRSSGHPVAISAERKEKWAWCFIHQQFLPY